MVFIPDGHFNFGSLILMSLISEKNSGKSKDWSDWSYGRSICKFHKSNWTDAEKQKQAAVFSPDPHHNGGNSNLDIPGECQMAQTSQPSWTCTLRDKKWCWAVWLEHDLPTELEWEYAANHRPTRLYTKHLPMSISIQLLARCISFWKFESR